MSRPVLPITVTDAAFEGLSTFAESLADEGMTRGLLGPKERDRLWDRHLWNCAVVAEHLPARARVADVGSGAGLPGVVWAITRPDLQVTLLEPSLRRTTYLTEIVDRLGIAERVHVWRGRAEQHQDTYRVVTARAVAALPKLVRWCLPLVEPGGVLMAFKGDTAESELRDASAQIARAGGTSARVTTYGEGVLETPTTVVEVDRR